MNTCIVCGNVLPAQKQRFCSNACKQKEHYHRLRQQTNSYHSQTIRSLIRKIKLIEILGGSCAYCGYNANVSALHFHHKDHTDKLFKLDMRILSNKKWELILEEAQKCELLCANCHAELHNPALTFENVQRIIQGASHRKRWDEQGVNSGKS